MEKLIIYQKALLLIKDVYSIINNHSLLKKDYSLNDQIRRASVSVATNIAEGYYRSNKQSIYYLNIASGSANETRALLQIITLIYNINTIKLQEEYKILGKQIISYSKKIN
jgi:four helix bundle protein